MWRISVNETGYDYIRDVASWEVHPQFDEVSFDNDFAIPFLSTAVTEVTPLVLNADAGVPDGTILPLFLSRVVERFQLERGLVLWHRSVEILFLSQGLVLDYNNNEPHVLTTVNQVYDIAICL